MNIINDNIFNLDNDNRYIKATLKSKLIGISQPSWILNLQMA